MSIEVERIAGSCGAVVRGIDVGSAQSAEQIEALRCLLDEHLVVVLPDQHLGLDRLEAFTDEPGGRDITTYVRPVDGRPSMRPRCSATRGSTCPSPVRSGMSTGWSG